MYDPLYSLNVEFIIIVRSDDWKLMSTFLAAAVFAVCAGALWNKSICIKTMQSY